MNSTRAPSSSRGVQWGLSEMPDVATQAHRGPRSQGSDHGSKSQRAGTEKRAGERLLPSRSNSTRKGTHHVVKRPDQAGRRGPARGPTHLHPTRDTTVNPTTTRSYVEVVRGVAQRSGRPATVRGPPHVTRYILLPRAPTHPPQPPSAQQRHEGEGRGFVLRSPKDGLSAGTWRRKVVMCPRRGNDPASGHPRAHQPPLGRGTSPPAWDGRLDAPGQRRRHLPSSAWTRRREVKQGKSGGSVGTTDQGKGKGRSVVRPMGTVAYRGKGQGKGKGRGEGRLGQGGRGRSKGGEKLMGTTAYGGKGSKGRAANGDRPVGAASCRRDHHTMASCQNPPRRWHLPSSAWTRRREVKQGKSGGSVGTTDQGKGKGRSVVRPMGTVAYRGKGQGKGKGRGEGRLGQGGRGRSKGGEKLMGTTAYGGKGSKGRAANGDRPVGAASCRRDHHTMASCQNPPRRWRGFLVFLVGKQKARSFRTCEWHGG